MEEDSTSKRKNADATSRLPSHLSIIATKRTKLREAFENEDETNNPTFLSRPVCSRQYSADDSEVRLSSEMARNGDREGAIGQGGLDLLTRARSNSIDHLPQEEKLDPAMHLFSSVPISDPTNSEPGHSRSRSMKRIRRKKYNSPSKPVLGERPQNNNRSSAPLSFPSSSHSSSNGSSNNIMSGESASLLSNLSNPYSLLNDTDSQQHEGMNGMHQQPSHSLSFPSLPTFSFSSNNSRSGPASFNSPAFQQARSSGGMMDDDDDDMETGDSSRSSVRRGGGPFSNGGGSTGLKVQVFPASPAPTGSSNTSEVSMSPLTAGPARSSRSSLSSPPRSSDMMEMKASAPPSSSSAEPSPEFEDLLESFAQMHATFPKGMTEECPICFKHCLMEDWAPHVYDCLAELDAQDAQKQMEEDHKVALLLAAGVEAEMPQHVVEMHEELASTLVPYCTQASRCSEVVTSHFQDYIHPQDHPKALATEYRLDKCFVCGQFTFKYNAKKHVNLCLDLRQLQEIQNNPQSHSAAAPVFNGQPNSFSGGSGFTFRSNSMEDDNEQPGMPSSSASSSSSSSMAPNKSAASWFNNSSSGKKGNTFSFKGDAAALRDTNETACIPDDGEDVPEMKENLLNKMSTHQMAACANLAMRVKNENPEKYLEVINSLKSLGLTEESLKERLLANKDAQQRYMSVRSSSDMSASSVLQGEGNGNEGEEDDAMLD